METERVLRIPLEAGELEADWVHPDGARGIVLFAHGSGSSRRSPRNRYVAEVLRRGKLATILLDLLTPEEEAIDAVTAQLRFDIPMLASRLASVTDWLLESGEAESLPVGYFGASTGAAAALIAAAERPGLVAAVVSRGGRPDLAREHLSRVQAAVLLIVGGWDTPVIELNREAFAALRCEKRLVVVPRASHLFEEPGALDEVARLAAEWFERHLALPVRAPLRAVS